MGYTLPCVVQRSWTSSFCIYVYDCARDDCRVANITDFSVEVRNLENDPYFSRFLYGEMEEGVYHRIFMYVGRRNRGRHLAWLHISGIYWAMRSVPHAWINETSRGYSSKFEIRPPDFISGTKYKIKTSTNVVRLCGNADPSLALRSPSRSNNFYHRSMICWGWANLGPDLELCFLDEFRKLGLV